MWQSVETELLAAPVHVADTVRSVDDGLQICSSTCHASEVRPGFCKEIYMARVVVVTMVFNPRRCAAKHSPSCNDFA